MFKNIKIAAILATCATTSTIFANGGGPVFKGIISSNSDIDKIVENDGLDALSPVTMMFGGMGYGTIGSWRIGGGGFGGGQNRVNEKNELAMALGYGGMYLAYEVVNLGMFSVSTGSFMGFGGGVVTQNIEGKKNEVIESYFMLEPVAGFELLPIDFLKIAVNASCLVPIQTHISKTGDNRLAVSNLYGVTPSVSIALIFGGHNIE